MACPLLFIFRTRGGFLGVRMVCRECSGRFPAFANAWSYLRVCFEGWVSFLPKNLAPPLPALGAGPTKGRHSATVASSVACTTPPGAMQDQTRVHRTPIGSPHPLKSVCLRKRKFQVCFTKAVSSSQIDFTFSACPYALRECIRARYIILCLVSSL